MRKAISLSIATLLAVSGIYLVTFVSAKPLAPGLKVAILVSDSGPLSFVGPIQRAAVRLATADLLESNNPIKVLPTYIQIGESPSDYARAFAKLKSIEFDLVIAPVESDSASALLASTKKNPLPIIAPSSLDDDLRSAISNKWLFRLASSPSQEGFALSEFISSSKPKSVLVVSSSSELSNEQRRSIAFGLIIRGNQVQTLGIKDLKTIAKTKPDALVLLSLEESLGFFTNLNAWVDKVPEVYLVPGNLADYSSFPWAKSLLGAQALAPKDQVSEDFKANLAKTLGNNAILSPRSSALLALGQRTYDAVTIAAQALQRGRGDGPEALRSALANSQLEGKSVFDKNGFYSQIEYVVYRYGANGKFSARRVFSPN